MKSKEVGGLIINPYCENQCLFCGGFEKVSGKEIQKQENKERKTTFYFKLIQ